MAGRPNLYITTLLNAMYQLMIPVSAQTLLGLIGGSKRTLYYNLNKALKSNLVEVVERKSNKSKYLLTSLGEKVRQFQTETESYKQNRRD